MLGTDERTNENADRKVRLFAIVVLHKKEDYKEHIVSNIMENTGQKRIHLTLNILRTGEADLRFYITTVQDG